MAVAREEDVDVAVTEARRAFEDKAAWADIDPVQRGELLLRLARLMSTTRKT